METKIKSKLLKIFSKIELKKCGVCGELISKKEHSEGEGACFKCWDK